MILEKILGVFKGKEGFAISERNFAKIQNEVNAHGTQINSLDAEVDTHKAETVSHQVLITRDISLSGVQTITLPFQAKSVIVNSAISSSKNNSIGTWGENNSQIVISRRGSDDVYIVTSGIIRIYNSSDNYITGTIQNVTSTGFEINWVKTGLPTGTVNVSILAHSHGGA